MHNREEQSRIAHEMIDSVQGDSLAWKVRWLSDVTGMHKTTIYDILRGDRIGEKSHRLFAQGLNRDPYDLLVAAGFVEAQAAFWRELECELRGSDLPEEAKMQIRAIARQYANKKATTPGRDT